MSVRKLALLTLVTIALSFNAVSDGHANPLTVPSGLFVGATYRVAFVTSTPADATSANIADYNAFVTSVANSVPELSSLGTTWSAIGSTPTVDARDNTGTNPGVSTGTSIYLLNDTLLASNNADLWDGSLSNSLNVTEQGNLALSTAVWTGTFADGTSAVALSLGGIDQWTVVGVSGAPNSAWIDGTLARPDTAPLSFYAISGILTVVPEPGTALLRGMGLAALGWRGKAERS